MKPIRAALVATAAIAALLVAPTPAQAYSYTGPIPHRTTEVRPLPPHRTLPAYGVVVHRRWDR